MSNIVKLQVTKVYQSTGKAPSMLLVKSLGADIKHKAIKVWRLDADRGIKEGTVVIVDLDVLKEEEYKGKWSYSCSTADIEIDHQETPPAVTGTPVPTSVWKEKDRKIVRQSMLKASVDFNREKAVDVDTVLEVAEIFESWVYRNECKPTSEQKINEEVGELPMDNKQDDLDF